MISHVVQSLRRFTHAVLADDTPHQLAAGFTLGMVIGMMPKGNLIALSLCVLLFSLRVNTAMGVLAVGLFTWIGPLADSVADKLGQAVLSADSLEASYATVYQLPLGPWLGFDNTVVTGWLLLGLYLAYPVYWFTSVACHRAGWSASPLATSRSEAGPAGTSLAAPNSSPTADNARRVA